ncbi:MAG: alpha/beta fold hydrolase [Planctomycetota bacterium]|jgi:pimeloyl-ACP methyl ester carboxylesterase
MKRVPIEGIELATVDRGAGLPLVLVHGFPLDHAMWDAQIEELSGYCRVIAPDLRGFGRSGVTEGKVTMGRFADDVDALLNALGIDEPVVFCGLSMGGYVAWQFWHKYPSRTRGLVLCDTRAGADTPAAAAGRLKTAGEVMRDGLDALAESMLPKLLAPTTLAENAELVESLRRVMLATDRRGAAAAARGMAERPDFTPRLPEIASPALVLVGELDAISTPGEMRSVAEAIPGARYVEIPAAGHMAPLENPAPVNAAIRAFLASLGG